MVHNSIADNMGLSSFV